MADKKKKKTKKDKKDPDTLKKKDFIKEIKIAYRGLENPRKFHTTILLPLIVIGVIVFLMPFILNIIVPIPLNLNPISFVVGGIVPIILGVFYPYITWKNKENDINGKMHFFITHLRVLAISDLSLKDIINILGGKKAYGALGDELKKIGVLSTQWRMPLSKTFRFISERTPSKLLKDFLDRFSQSLDSGVEHREFIETEQEAVIQEYKTMYESSNENVIILNEVYVAMLIAIIFVMSLGIVLPIIIGTEDMNMFIYLSSFLLIISEGLLMYLLKAMVPQDEIWHVTGEQGELEEKVNSNFKSSVFLAIFVGAILFFGKYFLSLPFIQILSFEIIIAISLTPLLITGIMVFTAEIDISRKEKNFLSFLPALGSISAMRGGKINESVYYLSEKDYGVLTRHIRNLYRRLRTRIDDDSAWDWFGVDTGSNYVQRSSEMFREATYAAANPRIVSRMISENIRKIRDLRVKKLTIVNTSIALFAGITFGIAFAIYVSLIIGRHLNNIMMETGNPFENVERINIPALLNFIDPAIYNQNFIVIFLVLVIHCLMMALTLRILRGSHKFVTLLYFVPFVWIVAITSYIVEVGFGGMLST
ncbi:MAG: archaellar assembly protein FlaJ [Thermoplasmatales archaeon]|nr:MAG: archaellar assembly protein FlaJ [Thermoplasmatales archaeon]